MLELYKDSHSAGWATVKGEILTVGLNGAILFLPFYSVVFEKITKLKSIQKHSPRNTAKFSHKSQCV